jgi:hypothetical protein
MARAMVVGAAGHGRAAPGRLLRGVSAARDAAATAAAVAEDGYRDASYEVNGVTVRLVRGVSDVEAAPGAASRVVTRVFGNEARGDLDGDGVADVAFVLTQTAGGSGTFFYAAAALRTSTGWRGTNAVLLGDRVAPQPTEVRDGIAIMNYADRKPGEPMTARPSVGVSKYLKVAGGRLVER